MPIKTPKAPKTPPKLIYQHPDGPHMQFWYHPDYDLITMICAFPGEIPRPNKRMGWKFSLPAIYIMYYLSNHTQESLYLEKQYRETNHKIDLSLIRHNHIQNFNKLIFYWTKNKWSGNSSHFIFHTKRVDNENILRIYFYIPKNTQHPNLSIQKALTEENKINSNIHYAEFNKEIINDLISAIIEVSPTVQMALLSQQLYETYNEIQTLRINNTEIEFKENYLKSLEQAGKKLSLKEKWLTYTHQQFCEDLKFINKEIEAKYGNAEIKETLGKNNE